jgi:hypothetical protein
MHRCGELNNAPLRRTKQCTVAAKKTHKNSLHQCFSVINFAPQDISQVGNVLYCKSMFLKKAVVCLVKIKSYFKVSF